MTILSLEFVKIFVYNVRLVLFISHKVCQAPSEGRVLHYLQTALLSPTLGLFPSPCPQDLKWPSGPSSFFQCLLLTTTFTVLSSSLHNVCLYQTSEDSWSHSWWSTWRSSTNVNITFYSRIYNINHTILQMQLAGLIHMKCLWYLTKMNKIAL